MTSQVVGLAAAARYLARSEWTPSRHTRPNSSPPLLEGLAERARGPHRRADVAGRPRFAGQLRRRRHPRPRRRPDPRRRRRRRAGGSSLRVAAAPQVRYRRHRAGIVRACTTRSTRWTGWWRASSAPSSSSAGTEFRRENGADVPGGDPGPLQAPAPPRAARAVRRRGASRQSDVRRRSDAEGCALRGRGDTSPTSHMTGRAARSARPRRRCSPTW